MYGTTERPSGRIQQHTSYPDTILFVVWRDQTPPLPEFYGTKCTPLLSMKPPFFGGGVRFSARTVVATGDAVMGIYRHSRCTQSVHARS